jgi:predicted nucleic acid-binding protein
MVKDRPVAVIDASVLYSAALRDLLMHLHLEETYQPRWSDRIHAEWIRGILRARPDVTAERLERTRELMDAHALDAKVEGFEEVAASLTGLPDPDDAHVIAAAIKANASVIVTWNLKHFPPSFLEPYAIEALEPDAFLSRLLKDDPEAFRRAVRRHQSGLRNPPRTMPEYLETLDKQGLRETVQSLKAGRES